MSGSWNVFRMKLKVRFSVPMHQQTTVLNRFFGTVANQPRLLLAIESLSSNSGKRPTFNSRNSDHVKLLLDNSLLG